MRRILLSILFLAIIVSAQAGTLKVLAIGNSFSEDAVEKYLYQLAAEQGDTLLIGDAVIGGCSIDRHLSNLKSEKRDYRYRRIEGGELVEHQGLSLPRIIQDEDWDIITLQQVSYQAGDPNSFGNLAELKKQVLKLATNPNVEIVWHMTWSYPRASKNQGFAPYNFDQQAMYDSIVVAMNRVLPEVGIERYIPTGTALQKAREELGDIFNRDGLHLKKTIGRYLAGCVWCEFLTGKDITLNPWWPEDISGYDMRIIKRAVHETFAEMQSALPSLQDDIAPAQPAEIGSDSLIQIVPAQFGTDSVQVVPDSLTINITTE